MVLLIARKIGKTALPMAFALMCIVQNSAQAESLNIPPVTQQTAVWCWAAVSEMALRYYGLPNLNPAGDYQCGIVGTTGGPCSAWCGNCIRPIGSTFQMAHVLNNYQVLASQFMRRRLVAFQARPHGRLTPDQIRGEVDEGRPVIVGISPSGMGAYYPAGMSEHVALIVGYDRDSQDLWLKVNDPMPYQLFGYDPYLDAGAEWDDGSYWIPYRVLVQRFSYKDTIVLH